jgi:hypothetical protein
LGDEDDRDVGTAIAGLTNVTALSAGGYHTCALIAGGTIKCWGRNFGGQLGTSNETQYNTPQDVVGLTGVTAIATGGDHSCALTTGNVLKCWGWNGEGQLGDRTTNASNSPIIVAGLHRGVVAIDGGEQHSCAMTDTGLLKCWGLNDEGQVGDGSTDQRLQWADVFPVRQSIGFTPPATASTTESIILGAMSTSGLDPSFDGWTPSTCSVLNDTVTPHTNGFCGVRASQVGDVEYAAAPQQLRIIFTTIEMLFKDGFE